MRPQRARISSGGGLKGEEVQDRWRKRIDRDDKKENSTRNTTAGTQAFDIAVWLGVTPMMGDPLSYIIINTCSIPRTMVIDSRL